MIKNAIPSESDWGSYKDNLDLAYAFRKFGGKSLDEVAPYFETAPWGPAELLCYMPAIPFQYYVQGFRKLLLSERMWEDPNGEGPNATNSFLNMVHQKLRDNPADILPVMPDLMPVIEFVVKHQMRFGAAVDIYGDYGKKLVEIENLYAAALQSGAGK